MKALSGTVASGDGTAAIRTSEVIDEIRALTGWSRLLPGTVNVRLSERRSLSKRDSLCLEQFVLVSALVHNRRQLMTILDRGVQREILLKLSERYPDWIDTRQFPTDVQSTFLKNIAYLQEHGLVDANWAAKIATSNGVAKIKITARGLDFISDDGGLSAILGTVVVKLHEDTLKELLTRQVETSVQEPLRSKLISQIKALTVEGVKTVVVESVKAGIAHVPDLPSLIQTAMGGQ